MVSEYSVLMTNVVASLRVNPLNAQLNPICHLLALLGAHHILHVSRIRVKLCLRLAVVFVTRSMFKPHCSCKEWQNEDSSFVVFDYIDEVVAGRSMS